MWQHLLDLLTATRRPLVFVDFETAGLNGAMPVEFAIAYWTPWADAEMDDVSVEARKHAPPGLTYAASGRLNPGMAIDPEAQAVHGISAEDVAACPMWNDIGISSVFMSLAIGGDASGGEAPCVWAGHNIAEADIPWAQSWGYLPRDEAPLIIDTMRLTRRLGKDHPFPLAPDAPAIAGCNAWPHCPAVGHGIKPYAASLGGIHTALFGDPPSVQHGALADVLASARVLAGILDLWTPLWPRSVVGSDPNEALARLLAVLNEPPSGVSIDGWIKTRPGQAPKWNRGKCEGLAINADPGYARWVADLPSQPTGINGRAWCSAETRAALLTTPAPRLAASGPAPRPLPLAHPQSVASDDIPF